MYTLINTLVSLLISCLIPILTEWFTQKLNMESRQRYFKTNLSPEKLFCFLMCLFILNIFFSVFFFYRINILFTKQNLPLDKSLFFCCVYLLTLILILCMWIGYFVRTKRKKRRTAGFLNEQQYIAILVYYYFVDIIFLYCFYEYTILRSAFKISNQLETLIQFLFVIFYFFIPTLVLFFLSERAYKYETVIIFLKDLDLLIQVETKNFCIKNSEIIIYKRNDEDRIVGETHYSKGNNDFIQYLDNYEYLNWQDQKKEKKPTLIDKLRKRLGKRD